MVLEAPVREVPPGAADLFLDLMFDGAPAVVRAYHRPSRTLDGRIVLPERFGSTVDEAVRRRGDVAAGPG